MELHVGSPQSEWHTRPYAAIYIGTQLLLNHKVSSQWPPVKCLLNIERNSPRMPALPANICSHPRTTTSTPSVQPAYQRVSISKTTYKLSTFADDILLFLTEPHTELPKLLKHFTTFNTLILTYNFAKSEALNISLQKETLAHCQTNFPFRWNRDSITYLGIQLPSQLSDLYT